MELNGVPLHPLVVHAVVIFGPLAAVTGLVYAAFPRWRWLLRWPLVALAVMTAGAAVLGVASGEDLLAARPELEPLVEKHAEYGELLRTVALAFVVDAVLAAWALGGTSALASGAGARESKGVLGTVAMVLLVLGSIGLAVVVFLTGDSGAQAVWG